MRPPLTRRDFLKQSARLGAAAAALGAARSLAAEAPPAPAIRVPRIKFGGIEVSRLILDGDPFFGTGHPEFLVCKAMWQYYTEERVVETLEKAARFGVNAVLAPSGGKGPQGEWAEVFGRYVKQGGKVTHWIAEINAKTAGTESAVKRLAQQGAAAIFVPPSHTDGLLRARDWRTLELWIEAIRASKALVGIATYDPATLEHYEKRLPADFYVLYVYRFEVGAGDPSDEMFPPEARQKAMAALEGVAKPVVVYKALDPTSTDPPGELAAALKHLSAKDALAAGVYTKDDPKQVEKFCALAARQAGA